MILIFYITHKVISLHGENQIGNRNGITPDWSHGWNNFDRDAYADSKPLLLSNLRTTKMNDDVLAIAVSPDAKYIVCCTFGLHSEGLLFSLILPNLNFYFSKEITIYT
ncbi:hypothetical protein Pint_25430 [Pistacia integerrima]|uniref:Uncharacterized protein n=1 Tax=Pistacia integerrima TaxID=434235 RepID=A0ACC0YEM6_9ROSI|nr:hypothetical protein Pint_25430 [Pistacia integerrima]